jgi:hypothetical protein
MFLTVLWVSQESSLLSKMLAVQRGIGGRASFATNHSNDWKLGTSSFCTSKKIIALGQA